MSEKTYRIRANVGSDPNCLNVQLKQDVDFLEILSLKISQENLYKLHTSNYGVVVGRVLANDGFGIPNARLSIFVPLDSEDANDTYKTRFYMYTSAYSTDSAGRRYNLLPDEQRDDCYRIVGTFPTKRFVLDNDTQVEIFDKYWKFTVTTNQSGDYMIFGVPTGSRTLHVDIDLSNIGVLSQKPRDFFYKGYNITSFDNASQFKESTNLDSLVQIITQNQNIDVAPFWGDADATGNIAITRADVNVTYKFETTCVFMGSVVSDTNSNNIGCTCTPTQGIGDNRKLVASEGTIEMIRKTNDGLVEEVQIQGNSLIDGDGVWCYQIPMNLDYVVTDEFGELVPTDNPNKGIPTRTSARFRISISETGEEGISRHTAKYLVPNNPMPKGGIENNSNWVIEDWKSTEQNYEFGSATPGNCFRNLYWNKVYSVKNYIPRIQTGKGFSGKNYTGIRSINYHDDKNPFPFNNVRFQIPFMYTCMCILMDIFFVVAAIINAVLSLLYLICIPPFKLKIFGFKLYWCVFDFVKPVKFTMEDDTKADGSEVCYAPGTVLSLKKDKAKGCETGDMDGFEDRMQRGLAQDSEVVNLDFYNDWVNGALYLPLWFWRKTKKKKYFFGLFSKKAVNRFCQANKPAKLWLNQNSAIGVAQHQREDSTNPHKWTSRVGVATGVIYEATNRDDLRIYYYAPISTTNTNGKNIPWVRLFATDIILLGSFNDCDIDSVPKLFERLPSTTANIPFLVYTVMQDDDGNSTIDVTGMDWTHKEGGSPRKYGKGLMLDLGCASVKTIHKSIVNVRRMCELGVVLDSTRYNYYPTTNNLQYTSITPDGMITRYELEDIEGRSMFATLNQNGLDKLIYSPVTKYQTYDFKYVYPIDFDGTLARIAPAYTGNETQDNENIDYVVFRYGREAKEWNKIIKTYDNGATFPIFNNSFYFYFGLNAGKTALDKFYNTFYATCFNNHTEPFVLSVSGTPGPWCTQTASFSAQIEKIKLPYSFELLDTLGIVLWSEDNANYNMINVQYIKREDFMSENPNPKITIESGNTICTYYTPELTNGLYTLSVKDSFGRVIKKEINLLQSEVSVDIATLGLSAKYTVCKRVDAESSGKIILNSISYDGDEYRFLSDKPLPRFNNSEGTNDIIAYKLEQEGEKKDGKWYIDKSQYVTIQLSIVPANTLEDPSISSFRDVYSVNATKYNNYYDRNDSDSYLDNASANVGSNKKAISESKTLELAVLTSGDFHITAIAYCCDANGKNCELSDNMFTSIATIENGEELSLIMNEVDTAFIRQSQTDEGQIQLWTQVFKPEKYTFQDYKVDDDRWDKQVLNLAVYQKYQPSWTSTFIAYQLDCIMKICNATLLSTDSNSNQMEFSHSGGTNVVTYLGNPDFSAIDSENNKDNKLRIYNISKEENISVSSYYPTLIAKNYYTSSRLDYKTVPIDWSFNFNNILQTKELGIYAGIIDTNNTKRTVPANILPLKVMNVADDKIRYPANTTSMAAIDNKNNYFRIQTVDRRADFEIHVLKDENSYLNDRRQSIERKIEVWPTLTKFYNGVALAYDGNQFIITCVDKSIYDDESKNEVNKKILDDFLNRHEYYYFVNDKSQEGKIPQLLWNKNALKNRRYYSTVFATDIDSSNNIATDSEYFEYDETAPSDGSMPVVTLKKKVELDKYLTFSWSHASCSYNANAVVVPWDISGTTSDDMYSEDEINLLNNVFNTSGNTHYVDCTADEGGSLDGTLSTLDDFKIPIDSIHTIAEQDYFNISYRKNSLIINGIFLSYKIRQDVLTDCDVYTSTPIIIEKNNLSDKISVDDINWYYQNKAVRNTSVGFNGDYTADDYWLLNSSDGRQFIAPKNTLNRVADEEDLRATITYWFRGIGVGTNRYFYPVVKREYVSSDLSNTRLSRKVMAYSIGKRVGPFYNSMLQISVNTTLGAVWPDDIGFPGDPTVNGNFGVWGGKGVCHIIISGAIDKIALDDEGNYLVAARTIGNNVYSTVFKRGNTLVIPFYRERTTEDNTTEENQDTVIPSYYYKWLPVVVYMQEAETQLIHRFTCTF